MFASMLGFLLTIIIVGFISVGIIASFVAFAKKTDKTDEINMIEKSLIKMRISSWLLHESFKKQILYR